MNTDAIAKKLQSEKKRIEKLLENFTKKHPHEGEDYDVIAPEFDDRADMEDQVDFIEELGTLQATRDELSARLRQIDSALRKIDNGTYGVCERCGNPIEPDRLNVNAAAVFCGECLKK